MRGFRALSDVESTDETQTLMGGVFFLFPTPLRKKTYALQVKNGLTGSFESSKSSYNLGKGWGEDAKDINLKAPPRGSVNNSVSSNDFELNKKVTGSHNVDSEISSEKKLTRCQAQGWRKVTSKLDKNNPNPRVSVMHYNLGTATYIYTTI